MMFLKGPLYQPFSRSANRVIHKKKFFIILPGHNLCLIIVSFNSKCLKTEPYEKEKVDKYFDKNLTDIRERLREKP